MYGVLLIIWKSAQASREDTKNVKAYHRVRRWQDYNFGFREKKCWPTKYATLAKFRFKFFHVQTMYGCDVQTIYNLKL